MMITEEIIAAACLLGKSLHEDEALQPFFNALWEFQADDEARSLEEQLYATYHNLLARQQAGEQLSRDETQAFYELRRKVQTHPLIAKREYELRLIKPYLAEVADEISAILGVDYTILAQPTQ